MSKRKPVLPAPAPASATVGYKVLTHDLRSPIRGGPTLFDGTCPYTTPSVVLDQSDEECAAGWNFCRDGAIALRIAGYWPNGRSSRMFEVTPSNDAIDRNEKSRASVLTFPRELTETEIEVHIRALSIGWFNDAADAMMREQRAWRWVLGAGFDAKEAKAVRTRAWGAWDARDARGAWGAWDALDAWDAWGARDARGAWGAWDARDARGARGALTVFYVCVVRKWRPLPPSYAWLKKGVASMIPALPGESKG